MPLKRKLISLGNSKAITIPKSYLDYFEERHGKIDSFSIEVNGKLTIRPILTEVQENKSSKKFNPSY